MSRTAMSRPTTSRLAASRPGSARSRDGQRRQEGRLPRPAAPRGERVHPGLPTRRQRGGEASVGQTHAGRPRGRHLLTQGGGDECRHLIDQRLFPAVVARRTPGSEGDTSPAR